MPRDYAAEHTYHRTTLGTNDKPMHFKHLPDGWRGVLIVIHPRFETLVIPLTLSGSVVQPVAPQPRALLLRRVERLESPGKLLRAEARTGVRHPHRRPRPVRDDRHLELPAVGHRLGRVEQQIQHDLLDALRIRPDTDLLSAVVSHGDARLHELLPHELDRT